MALDELGNPRWDIPVPTGPALSTKGHPLPYLHPSIGIARPKTWRHSEHLWLAVALGYLAPTYILSQLALKALNWRRPYAKVTGLSGLLQRLSFRCITTWADRWSAEPVQAAMMFPDADEPSPLPIDIDMVEPVVVLYGLGVPTNFCCSGHEEASGVAYLGIQAGFEVPQSLIDALDKAWLPYRVERFEDGRTAIYDKGGDLRFAAILRAWAREQAPSLLPPSERTH